MLGIFLLYYIAKPFYTLAENHQKGKWLYAILAILAYYLGTFVAGILIALISELGFHYSIDNYNNYVLGLMAMPLGILFAWAFYKFLVRKWEKNNEFTDAGILDENIN